VAKETEAYKVVCPDADSFAVAENAEEAIKAMEGQPTRVNKAYVAKDKSGNTIGYALNVTGKGFGGDVTMALGLTADGKITGISFTELNETAGLGMRADEPAFRDQFTGKGGQLALVKGDASGDAEISAISGASVTSGAVISAVNAGLELYESTLKGGN
jgi:RnfABCDGE-type electron transport complex G subunit